MDQNNLNEQASQDNQYRATSNLNVALESPDINISGTTDVNMQDANTDVNMASSYNYQNELSNHDGSFIQETQQQVSVSNTPEYTPVLEKKEKNKKGKIEVSNELKSVNITTLFLIIVITFFPYIYDFFGKIKSMILNR